MKISKIFAGMSALAMAATMAVSASAQTLTIDNATVDEWANAFPKVTTADGKEADDFIDARSFQKDTELSMTVHFEWTDAGKEQGYCAVKPGFANGWKAFSTEYPDGVSGLPLKSTLTETDDGNGGTYYADADGNKVDIAIQDNDGFVQIYNSEVTEFTYTISADVVNVMIENASAENGFDGIVFQVGNNGMKITSIDFSQEVKLNSVMNAEANDSSTADTSSTGDTSSK
ncbi:MAG: hypothetical protein Q4E74_11715, partial [Ruminococcus sp.]|nr:hypothetical protein [Ruminococcus sp.]